MKKIIRILTFIIVLCTVMVATTACGGEESTEMFVLDTNGTKIISVTNYGKSFETIEIPDTITAIGENAFDSCTNLKEIIIPASVKSIASYAFNGCTALETVSYKSKVGENENENVPATIQSWANISFAQFASNPMQYAETFKLDGVEVTELNLTGLTAIKDRAFYGFENVTKLTLPSSLKTIGNEAFLGCSSVTELTIPANVTQIGNYAFAYCEGITEVTIPKAVTSLGSNAFADCTKLEKLTIANGSKLTSVAPYAFANCDALTTVDYQNKVDNWTKIAFANAEANPMSAATYFQNNGTELTEIALSNVKKIEENAFYGFERLKKITLPATVTLVNPDAFLGCDALETVNFLGTLDQWVGIKFRSKASNPMSMAEEFQIKGEKVTKVVLKSAQKVEDYAFYNMKDITEVEIPASVTYFGVNAFEGADNITKVNYLGTEDKWAEMSFKDLYSNPNTIANNFVWNGEQKTEITLTEAEKINKYVFRGFDNVTKVTIPKSVKTIDMEAFSGCTSLQEVSFVGGTSGLKSIGPRAFQDCVSLTRFEIPALVEEIKVHAFKGCTSLTLYTSLKRGDSKTAGWVTDWNVSNCPVVWQYTGE